MNGEWDNKTPKGFNMNRKKFGGENEPRRGSILMNRITAVQVCDARDDE